MRTYQQQRPYHALPPIPETSVPRDGTLIADLPVTILAQNSITAFDQEGARIYRSYKAALICTFTIVFGLFGLVMYGVIKKHSES